MKGGAIGETETRADRRDRIRLRKVAGEWFPTLPGDALDQIVAAAWIEARTDSHSVDRTAIVAAAAVRRLGLRALRGEKVELPAAAAERAAALTADEPAFGTTLRGQRFRRRARPEALGRKPPEARAAEPSAPTPPAARQPRELAEDEQAPPTRRRRGRRPEERPAAVEPSDAGG